jgi:hypothetical protein
MSILTNTDTKFLVDFIVSSEHIMAPLYGGAEGTVSSVSTSVIGGGSLSASHSRTSSMHSMGSLMTLQQQHHSRTSSSHIGTGDTEASATPHYTADALGSLAATTSTIPEVLSNFSTQLLERHHQLNVLRPVARVLTGCPGAVVNQFISLIENHFVAPLIHAATVEGQAALRRQLEDAPTSSGKSGNKQQLSSLSSNYGILLPPTSHPIVLQYDITEGKNDNNVVADSDVIPVENLEVFAVLYTLEDCIAYLCSHLLHGTATKNSTTEGLGTSGGSTITHHHDVDPYRALDSEGYTVYGGEDGTAIGTSKEDNYAILSEVWHTCGTWLLDLADAYYRLVVMNDNNQQQGTSSGRRSASSVEMRSTDTINNGGLALCGEAYLSRTWSPIGCFIRSLDYATRSSQSTTNNASALFYSATGAAIEQGVSPSEVWGRLADTLELYERQMYRLYRTGKAKSVDAAAQILHLPVADGVRIAGCTMEGPLSTFENDAESQDAERRFEQGGKGVVGVVMRSSFFTALECRISAVRVNPTNAVALNNLGVQLSMPPLPYSRSDGGTEGADEDSDDDNNLNGMPSIVRIDRNAPGAAGSAHSNVAPSLNSGGTELQRLNTLYADASASVNGVESSPLRSYTKQQCYLRSIESDPTFGLPWKNLADTILVPKSAVTIEDEQECGVLIGERLYCREDCVVECLVRDPANADAWNHLGCLLAEREIRRAATQTSTTSKASLVMPSTSTGPNGRGESLQQPVEGAHNNHNEPTHDDQEGVAAASSTVPPVAPLRSKSYLGREGTQEAVLRQMDTSLGRRRRVLDDRDIDSPALAIVSNAPVTKVHCFIKSLELAEDSTGDVWNNLGAALQDKYLVGDGGKGRLGKDQTKKSKNSSSNKKKKTKEDTTATVNGPDEHDDEEEAPEDLSYFSGYTSNTIAAVQLVLSGDVERIGENAGGNSVVGGRNGSTMANGTQCVKQTVPSVVRIHGSKGKGLGASVGGLHRCGVLTDIGERMSLDSVAVVGCLLSLCLREALGRCSRR